MIAPTLTVAAAAAAASSLNGSTHEAASTSSKTRKLSKSNVPSSQSTIDWFHQFDDPHTIALEPRLDHTHVQPWLKRIEEQIVQHSSDDPSASNEWQAQLSKILLARIYFESGQFKKALEALQNLALRLEDVTAGYGMVLLVQARAIKGICLEQQHDPSSAMEAYEAAWAVVNDHPDEKISESLLYWIEISLYRAILLRLRTPSYGIATTLMLLRAYAQLVAMPTWKTTWRMYKPWIIFRAYAQFLYTVCGNDTYVAPNNHFKHSPQGRLVTSAATELAYMMRLFRNQLLILAPYLSPTALNEHVLELAHLMDQCHDMIGWGSVLELKRIRQYLDKVRELTFNSVCIARQTFFVLVRLGHHDEAKFAFRSYMELVGLPDIDQMGTVYFDNSHMNENTVLEAGPLASKILKKLTTLGQIDTDQASAREQPWQTETAHHVVAVLLAAIQHLYAHDGGDGKMAAVLSEVTLALGQSCETDTSPDHHAMAQLHRVRGVSYGLLVAQCDHPDDRPLYHYESVASLKRATELCPDGWQNYFELARQQARMRDTHAAFLSVSRAIELQPDHLPSWHLFALLSSCSRYNQVPQALEKLETTDPSGFSATLPFPALDSKTAALLPVVSWISEEPNLSNRFALAEAHLGLRMAKLVFLQQVKGAEAVLELYKDVFAQYALLSQQLFGDTMPLYGDIDEPSTPSDFDDKYRASTDRFSFTSRRKSKTTESSFASSNTTAARSGRSRSVSMAEQQSHRRRRSSSVTSAMRSPDDLAQPRPSGDSSFGERPSVTPITGKASLSEVVKSDRAPSSTDTLSEPRKSFRKKSLHLMDIRGARRHHSSHGSSITQAPTPPVPESPGKTTQGRARHDSTVTDRSTTSTSLQSLLTASFSMASRRSSSSSMTTSMQSYTTATSIAFHAQEKNQYLRRQRLRWHQLLVRLWLMSTSSFIKAGRFPEASAALLEAEQLGLHDADVWHQLGRLCLCAQQDAGQTKDGLTDTALEAFKKALSLDGNHTETHVSMASTYIGLGEWELADGLLDRTIKGLGWDHAEAWYLMGTVAQHYNDIERAKDCFLYALELYETTPLQPFHLLQPAH
ncbi:uncharacterized protein BYT42DRAFT_413505 [Radiomyces spectabilis]|uniref:uncharacterized protein n=1 Tax=Radiomyces spectabilis TaxID=64574 RepID=UPI00221F96C6|nr:uncharacterized protein BYT42DRAFT_413505 [Radiomyces spectabilis]KAI8374621.1 hypothetical protein BYT42DRAFT_413505 [Radiomyces spectabilis]